MKPLTSNAQDRQTKRYEELTQKLADELGGRSLLLQKIQCFRTDWLKIPSSTMSLSQGFTIRVQILSIFSLKESILMPSL